MNHSSPRFCAARHSEYAPLSYMMKGGNRFDCLHVIRSPEGYAHRPAGTHVEHRRARGHRGSVIDDAHRSAAFAEQNWLWHNLI